MMIPLTQPMLYPVLIIDDNPAIHEDIRKILGGRPERDSAFAAAKSSLFGSVAPVRQRVRFAIDYAHQGLEGLEMARAALRSGQPYALAFVDVRMPPGLDGIETIVQLWDLDPELQIVLCTAYSDYTWEEILEKLKRPDSLVILKKPFDNIEMLQLAHALTEKWRLSQEVRRTLEGLDQTVKMRTAELLAANELLRQEMSERQQLGEALLESQNAQSILMENLPAGVIVVDPVTRNIERANETAARLFGAPVERIVGQHCHSFMCPAAKGACPVCDLGQLVDNSERELVRSDGTRLPVMKWVKRIRLQNQDKLLECFIDLSAHKRAEYELRVSEAQNRALISAIPDLIFSNHRDGEFLSFHASDISKLIMRPEDFLHRRPHEVLPEPLADRFVAACQEALHSGAVQEFTYVVPIDGRETHFEARVAPCTEDSVITLVRDITERRRAEDRQRRLQEQLMQSQKMESLGLLAGGVAHDINNVLGAILITASCHAEALPAENPAVLAFKRISKAAVRGGNMVKGLLSLARQNPVEEHDLDLNAMLLEEIQLLEHTTLAKVELEVDLAPDLLHIRGDSNALAHVFMNLCINAIDAIPDRGRLSIRTRNVDGLGIEVLVQDNGTGMPKEVLDRALEPFFTTKGTGKGTGLGLSMAYSTVKAHGGQIKIESEPGRGTRVKLRFPASVAGRQATELEDEPRSTSPARRLTVLVVDDDELIMDSMRMTLGSLGHDVVEATKGEEALAQLESGLKPDVVILDMNMPGLGGARTLPRIRALSPSLPILLATGRADQAVLDLLQGHADVILMPKPFDIKDLNTHLERIVQGRRASPSPP